MSAHVACMEQYVNDKLLHDVKENTTPGARYRTPRLSYSQTWFAILKDFNFLKRVVDLAEFKLTLESVKHLLKYLDAIRYFLLPNLTTDIGSWFGLSNQVFNYAKLTYCLTACRRFLSPGVRF